MTAINPDIFNVVKGKTLLLTNKNLLPPKAGQRRTFFQCTATIYDHHYDVFRQQRIQGLFNNFYQQFDLFCSEAVAIASAEADSGLNYPQTRHVTDQRIKITNVEAVSNYINLNITNYLDSLNVADLILIITYLCYYQDGVTNPELVQLLYQGDPATLESSIKLRVIIELTEQFSQRIVSYQIDEVRTYFSNRRGLEIEFLTTLDQVREHAERLLLTFHSMESIEYEIYKIKCMISLAPMPIADEVVLAKALHIVAKSIENFNEIVKGLSKVDFDSAKEKANTKSPLDYAKDLIQVMQELKHLLKQNAVEKQELLLKQKKLLELVNGAIVIVNQLKTYPQNLKEAKAILQLTMIQKELHQASNKVKDYRRAIKGGGRLDPLTSLAKGTIIPMAASTALSSFASTIAAETTAETTYISGETHHLSADPSELLKLSANFGINVVFQMTAALAWAFSRRAVVGSTNMEKQAVGAYKSYIIKLTQKYYQSGSKLTTAELRNFSKFLRIKRGSFLTSNFSLRAKSYILFRQVQQTLKAKSTLVTLNHSESDPLQLAQANTMAYFKSLPNLKQQLCNLLRFKEFHGLAQLLDSSFIPANKIPKLIFKLGKLRGNLLTHLIAANVKEPNNKDLNKCLDVVIRLTEKHCVIFNLMRQFDYASSLLYLKEVYQIRNPYSFLLDWQHILLAIVKNNRLTASERSELIHTLREELDNKSEGKFRAIRVKRNLFYSDLSWGGLSLQSFTIKSVVNIFIDILTTLSQLFINLIQTIGSGIAWIFFTLLRLCNEESYKTGNTITFISAQQMSTDILEATYFKVQGVNHVKPEQAWLEKDTALRTFQARIAQKIKKATCIQQLKEVVEEIRTAVVLDKYKVYLALNNLYHNDLLVNQLLSKIEIILAQGPTSNAYYIPPSRFEQQGNQLLRTILELWGDIVAAIVQFELSYQVDGHTKPLPHEWSVADFKAYTAQNGKFITANEALKEFYKVLGLVYLDPNKENRAYKMLHIAGIILRAQADNTSTWHNLRNRTARREFVYKALVRGSAVLLWGSGVALTGLSLSSNIVAPGLGLVAAATIIVLLGALRGVAFAASDDFLTTNTAQYKRSIQVANNLTRNVYCNLSIEASKKVALLLRQQNNLLYENIEAVINPYFSGSNKLDLEVTLSSTQRFNRIMDNCIPNANTNIDKITSLIGKLKAMTTDPIILTDKHLASQSLFEVVVLIYAANIKAIDKLDLILQISHLFKTRALKLAIKLSTERSFIRKRNYFIPDLVSSELSAISSLFSMVDFGVSSAMVLSAEAATVSFLGDMLATLSVALTSSEPFAPGNTSSYQKCMKFLKIAAWYFLAQAQEEYFEYKPMQLEKYEAEVKILLKTHTGRFGTRFGNTATYKAFSQHT